MFNKASVLSGWKKVSYDDIARTPCMTLISLHSEELIRDFSKRMGITQSKFLELAITSAVLGSPTWRKAEERYEAAQQDRRYLQKLRRKLVNRQISDAKLVTPEESELKNIFKAIVEQGVSGRKLEQLLEQEGLAINLNKREKEKEKDGKKEAS